ncbi:sigma-54-dependent transcriptional regulator [Mucisphaera sp.]|uniref:sigma-54-dependent transcriptional regulator n=1 Tax=Mucisphaera sp. TaxID=2913024 RepID=UPI003D13B9CD
MSTTPHVLIIDDDPFVAEGIATLLKPEGYHTSTAANADQALQTIDQAHTSDRTAPVGIAIVDLGLPGVSGEELLRKIRDNHPSIVPVVITGFARIESAVQAMKLGATDYLTKPIVDEELLRAVERAAHHHALIDENQRLRDQLTQRFGQGNLIGSDPRMQKIYDMIGAVADAKTTALISGESGTGKTMVARAIHTHSPRADHPFITFSCGSIPETLLESELFGHVKGAFTGADADKAGRVLAADGGTLFIDEINSATPALQLKLLRVLQERAFEPVGSTKTREVDTRFILATNKPLQPLVEQGLFREDLYYRINVVNLEIPPLRERTADIDLLTNHFLEEHCQEMGKRRRLSNETIQVLHDYAWPGNVRELENAIERAVLLSREATIQPDDLPEHIVAAAGEPRATPTITTGPGTNNTPDPNNIDNWIPMPLSEALEGPERNIILAAIRANGGNKQRAADQLGINRTTLYKKMHKLGLPV